MCCTPVLTTGKALPQASCTDSAHVDLPPNPQSARRARAFVADCLNYRLPRETVYVAKLLASELVTNAIVHAGSPLQLGISYDDAHMLIAVGDDDPGRPVPRRADPDSTSGRGLVVVDRYCESWGTTVHASGKTVWCALPLPWDHPRS